MRLTSGTGDVVVLVDARGVEIGTAPKLLAHRSRMLHRAVSVFGFDGDGRVLLQRRASGKYHFGGLWSNTCCTHPVPGETPVAAGLRRVPEEMGVVVAGGLEEVGTFTYEASDPASGLYEHEFDHVLVGRVGTDPDPDPGEVSEWCWAVPAELREDIAARPDRYTPWLLPALDLAVLQRP